MRPRRVRLGCPLLYKPLKANAILPHFRAVVYGEGRSSPELDISRYSRCQRSHYINILDEFERVLPFMCHVAARKHSARSKPILTKAAPLR